MRSRRPSSSRVTRPPGRLGIASRTRRRACSRSSPRATRASARARRGCQPASSSASTTAADALVGHREHLVAPFTATSSTTSDTAAGSSPSPRARTEVCPATLSSSSMWPRAATRPRFRIVTSSEIASTSESWCDESRIVAPAFLSSTIRLRTSRCPTGSSPDAGSSSTSTSGVPSSAVASPSRCSMPRENFESSVFWRPSSPTRSSSSALCCSELGSRQAAELPVERHRLARGELAREVRLLGQEAEPGTRAGLRRRHAEDLEAPAGGPHEAEQHLQRRGLAGAVRAEQPVDRPARDADRDVGHRLAATAGGLAVVLARVLDENRGDRSRRARTSLLAAGTVVSVVIATWHPSPHDQSRTYGPDTHASRESQRA